MNPTPMKAIHSHSARNTRRLSPVLHKLPQPSAGMSSKPFTRVRHSNAPVTPASHHLPLRAARNEPRGEGKEKTFGIANVKKITRRKDKHEPDGRSARLWRRSLNP